MKLNFKKIFLSSAISLMGGYAAATPVINPDYTTNINVPVEYEGSEWHYGESVSDLYVVPPTEGSVTLNSYAPQNASYCTDLELVRATEQNATTTLALLSEQLFALIVEYGLYEFEMDSSGRPIIVDNQPVFRLDEDGEKIPTEFKVELDVAEAAANEADLVVDEAEQLWIIAQAAEREAGSARDDARDALSFCREDADFFDEDWREFCAAEYDDYLVARTDYSAALSAERDAEDAYYDADFAYARADSVYDELRDELSDNSARVSDMKFTVSQEKAFLSAMYNEIAGIYGGQLNMTYRTNWTDVVSSYALVNPTKNVRRVAVYNPLISMGVPADVLVNNPGLANSPGLAWSYLNIGGIGASQDFTTMPDGESTVIETNELPGWSDSFQGQAGLLLRSSCEMIDGTEGLSGSALFTAYSNNFSEYLAPSISYSYDVKASVAYEASYNLSEFMEIIKKVTQRSGFFSSSSSSEVSEEFESSEAFNMEFTADARNDVFTDDDKQELKEIVRARLLRQVLDAVGRREMVEDPNLEFVPVPDSFSSQFSSSLRGTCKLGWGYRCWGGWVLSAIGSIWGGSSTATTSFEQNNDFTANESVSDYFFINYDRAINFPSQNNQ